MNNRFMLAPLTNLQSHPDGTLSDDEYRWLTMRAEGGFGLTMTCASHVSPEGLGFPGQLGCFDDVHIPGLQRLATGIKTAGSLAVVQLHHAGMRAHDSVADKLCPSENAEFGARAMTHDEVRGLRDHFIAAAVRAQKAGFDGVELHGAHGYVLAQFLSPTINQRADEYGGSLENRCRLICEIIAGIRSACGDSFMIGLRLSPERFDIQIGEMLTFAEQLCRQELVDFLDMSLWSSFKEPEDPDYAGKPLIDWFTAIDRGNVRLGVAGKIFSPDDARRCLEHHADFVLLGRAAILHHNYPQLTQADPAFTPATLPVSAEYLQAEGLGKNFLNYMRTWKGFVAE